MTGESVVYFSFGAIMYNYVLDLSADETATDLVSYNYRIMTISSGGASTWFRHKRDTEEWLRNKRETKEWLDHRRRRDTEDSFNETDEYEYEANKVKCIYTFTITISKVKFYNASRRLNPCNEDNQSNSGAPYIEVIDKYNVTTRICSLEGEHVIDSFGDEIEIKVLGEFDRSMVPNVTFAVKQSEHCCGGIFYAKYGKGIAPSKQMATSPNYPHKYDKNQKCAYVFKCIPKEKNGTCRIGLHFADFELEGSNKQVFQQIQRDKGVLDVDTKEGENDSNTLISLSEKSPSSKNKCGRKDQILISTCGILYPKSSTHLCAGDHPDSFEAEDEILLMFLSNGDHEDRGFVVYYHVLDDEYGTYTEQEDESDQSEDPPCRCGAFDSKEYKAEVQRRSSLQKPSSALNWKPSLPEKTKRSLRRQQRSLKVDELKRLRRESHGGSNKKSSSNIGTKKKNIKRRNKSKKETKDPIKNKSQPTPKINPIKRIRTNTAKKPSDSNPNSIKKTNLKIQRKKSENRLIGGNQAKNKNQNPWAVLVIQAELKKKKSKKKKKRVSREAGSQNMNTGKARKNRQKGNGAKKKIARSCMGAIISKEFVITTTSCCTYCVFVWKKNAYQQQLEALDGYKENSAQHNKTIDNKLTVEGTRKKRQVILGKKRTNQNSNGKPLMKKSPNPAVRKNKNKVNTKARKNTRAKEVQYNEPQNADIRVVIGIHKMRKKDRVFEKATEIAKIFIDIDCYRKMDGVHTYDATHDEDMHEESYSMECPVIFKLNDKLAQTPICLPMFETFILEEEQAAAAGFGRKSSDTKANTNTLRWSTGITQYSNKPCMEDLKQELDDSLYCSKSEESSMCLGDEGAPYMLYRDTEKGFGEHMTLYALLATPGCNSKVEQPDDGKGKDKAKKGGKGSKRNPGNGKSGNGNNKGSKKNPDDGKGKDKAKKRGKGSKRNPGNGKSVNGNNKGSKKKPVNNNNRNREAKSMIMKPNNVKQMGNDIKNGFSPAKKIDKKAIRSGKSTGRGKRDVDDSKGERLTKTRSGTLTQKRKIQGTKGEGLTKKRSGTPTQKRKIQATEGERLTKTKSGAPTQKRKIKATKTGSGTPTNKGRRPTQRRQRKPNENTRVVDKLPKADLNKYYNERETTNKKGIDVWIQLSSYINWIQKVAFKSQDKFNCYRPVDRPSAPDKKKKEVESRKVCENVLTVVDHRGIGY